MKIRFLEKFEKDYSERKKKKKTLSDQRVNPLTTRHYMIIIEPLTGCSDKDTNPITPNPNPLISCYIRVVLSCCVLNNHPYSQAKWSSKIAFIIKRLLQILSNVTKGKTICY